MPGISPSVRGVYPLLLHSGGMRVGAFKLACAPGVSGLEQPLTNWGRIIENQIAKAIEAGAFDNLPGRGRPLALEENPHVDPEWRLAYHLLHSNDFTLPWMALRRDVAALLAEARAEVTRAWMAHARLAGFGCADIEGTGWNLAEERFRKQVEALNSLIRTYNLKAPSFRLHLVPLDADRELQQLKNLDEQEALKRSHGS